jgi:hypothetical protein
MRNGAILPTVMSLKDAREGERRGPEKILAEEVSAFARRSGFLAHDMELLLSSRPERSAWPDSLSPSMVKESGR